MAREIIVMVFPIIAPEKAVEISCSQVVLYPELALCHHANIGRPNIDPLPDEKALCGKIGRAHV